MKHSFFLLALVHGTVAFAQQPTEWRPSIAEDNKAATLEDTSKFLVNSLSAPLPSYFNEAIYDPHAPNSCSLGFTRILPNLDNSKRVTILLDITKVDPLSIVVRKANTGNPSQPYTGIAMEGTSKQSIAQFQETKITDKRAGAKNRWSVKFIKDFQCTQSAASCEITNTTSATAGVVVGNEEDSKRFARALMHAALLCGGTKAVSPF